VVNEQGTNECPCFLGSEDLKDLGREIVEDRALKSRPPDKPQIRDLVDDSASLKEKWIIISDVLFPAMLAIVPRKSGTTGFPGKNFAHKFI